MEKNEHADLERINALLKKKLLQRMPKPGAYQTGIEGVGIYRRDEANQLENCFYRPLVAVVVQGFKCSIIGAEEYRYGKNHCMVAGVDMPSASSITSASPDEPFLGMSLSLDKGLIAQLAAEVPSASKARGGFSKGVSVADVEPAVLGAFLRLVELIERPEQIPVLAPMIIREIHFRLLTGPQGESLRMLNTQGTQSNQIAQAVLWLRENFKEFLKVDALAQRVNMAPSTFHRHFREVTTLSPLQFQKHLRLHEAQRLMLLEGRDAASAGITVGYESPTQFNREYKRLFGDPPRRNVSRIR